MKKELLTRYENNPILTYKSLPFLCNAIYNPGATLYNNKYILLARYEDGKRDNRLIKAVSEDGYHFDIDEKPVEYIIEHNGNLTEKHAYDPRITQLEGTYYVTYCSQDFGEMVRIGLLQTDDFESYRHLGFITPPWNRNCAIFPEKIGGKYARIERPMSGSDVVNLVSYSDDLIHWGGYRRIDLKQQTWFREKWGIGPTPIKTEKGWLVIIHGVWLAVNYVYRLGVILLDGEDPSKVIGAAPSFILTPRTEYERIGETFNCVFSNGAVVEPDGTIKVYYGAADSCIGAALTSVDDLLQACR